MTCRAAETATPKAGSVVIERKKNTLVGYTEVGGFISNKAKETLKSLKCEAEKSLTTEELKKWLEAIKVSGSGTPLKTTGRERGRALAAQWRREQQAAAKNHRRRDGEVTEERKLMKVFFFLLPTGAGIFNLQESPNFSRIVNKKISLDQFDSHGPPAAATAT